MTFWLTELFYKIMENPEWIDLEKLIENKDFDHLFVKKNNTVNIDLADIRSLIFAFINDTEDYLEEKGLIISLHSKNKEVE
ncbi:MAG: hypothetical protein NWF06_00710 [Candidatus Bathyarchaeota archaeon]|nr:hypothetical protein [Candidatus Bathyarchaeum sp.]